MYNIRLNVSKLQLDVYVSVSSRVFLSFSDNKIITDQCKCKGVHI